MTGTVTIFHFNEPWAIQMGDLYIALRGPAIQCSFPRDVLDWLNPLLVGLPVTLKIVETTFTDEWFTWLGSNHNVTELTLVPSIGPFGDMIERPILKLLSQPLPAPSHSWLMPELECIEVGAVDEVGIAMILDMVRARRASTLDEGIGDRRLAPKPFRKISLYGRTNGISLRPEEHEGFLAELAEAAIGAEIWWRGKRWIRDQYVGYSSEGNFR